MTPTVHVHERIVDRLKTAASASLTDVDLLCRYLDGRDQTAFAALVERHSKFVFSLCWRRLGNTADAEDAVQAVFLALARNARSIRKRASLGAWLYGASHRVCLTIRRTQARSTRDLRRGARTNSHDPLAELSARELMSVIDQEMERLPTNLKVALELCLLEGMSIDEVAAQMNWSATCVKGRLQRGRERLRRRLNARGVALGVGLTAAMLESASAGMPVTLLARTFDAARGQPVSATIARLAHSAAGSSILIGRPSIALVLCSMMAITALVGGADPHDGQSRPAKAPHDPVPVESPIRVDAFGDPLPAGAIARLGSIRFHTGMWPKHLAYSPDGSKFASVAFNHQINQLTIWDSVTGQPIRQVDLPSVDIDLLQWFGDGRGFALVRVKMGDYVWWEFTDEKAKPPVFEDERSNVVGNGTFIASAASPNGTMLAAGQRAGQRGNEGKLEVWNLAANGHVREMRRIWQWDSPSVFLAVKFTSDNKKLVCINQQQEPWRPMQNPPPNGPVPIVPGKVADFAEVSVHDSETGREGIRFRAIVGGYIISPDGETLFAGGRSGTIVAYDLRTGIERFAITAFKSADDLTRPISCLAILPNGKTLVATVRDPTYRKYPIAAFDANSGEMIWRNEGTASSCVYGVAVAPDSKQLVIAYLDGLMVRCDPTTGRVIDKVGRHRGGLGCVWTAPDNKSVITGGSSDCAIRSWDIESGKQLIRPIEDEQRVHRAFDIAPNGKLALSLSRIQDGSVFGLLDVASGESKARLPGDWQKFSSTTIRGGRPVAWLPDNSVVFSDGGQEAIRYDERGKEIQTFAIEGGRTISGIAAAPNGKTVALCGIGPRSGFQTPPGWVQVFDVATGKPNPLWESATDFTNAVYSPDSSKVILCGIVYHYSHGSDSSSTAGDFFDAVVSFDIALGKGFPIFEAPGGIENARCARMIAISLPGYQLAVSEYDHSITVYETATGKIRHRFRGHRNEISQLSFTRDGRRLVSCGRDGTGLVWDVTPGVVTQSDPLHQVEFTKNWQDLATLDAPTALRAMGQLARDPVGTIAWMKSNFKPSSAPSEAEIQRLIDSLGASDFREREDASRKLEMHGGLAVAYARQALAKVDSPEASRRLTAFLNQNDKHGILSGVRLQERRAVELLETIGNPAARELLRSLGNGKPSPLAQDCTDALKRLDKQ